MKFSPDFNHKSVINWWKNFGHSTTDMSATPLFVSKLRKGLAASLFEIFSKKFFWWGSRPISVTQWQEFQISPKKWCFEIFGTSAPSRGNWVIHDVLQKVARPAKDYSISSGYCTRSKNFITPFFGRYLKFVPLGNWYGSRTSPKNFVWKYLKKYRR